MIAVVLPAPRTNAGIDKSPEAAFQDWAALRTIGLPMVCVLLLLLTIPPLPIVNVSGVVAVFEFKLNAPAPELKVSERIE